MSTQPPQNIFNSVHAVAMQFGIPDAIWEDVAQTESVYNPQAVGDNGTSFGLFQLHIGGQLPPQYNNNPQAVFDPTLNAQLAMPAIARAWNNLKGSFNPGSISWWQQFAGQSGHPGGTPGVDPANINEARILQSNYSGSSNPGSSTPSPLGTQPTDCSTCLIQNGMNASKCIVQCQSPAQGAIDCVSNPSSCVQQAILGPVETGVTAALPRVALFIFAIVLIVAGFFVLTK